MVPLSEVMLDASVSSTFNLDLLYGNYCRALDKKYLKKLAVVVDLSTYYEKVKMLQEILLSVE